MQSSNEQMSIVDEGTGQVVASSDAAVQAQMEESFEHAIALQNERALGAAFAHRCLTVVLWMAPALVLSIGANGYLGWKVAHPDVKYFAAEDGRVIELIPTDKPSHSQTDVSAFGADTIRNSFTLDFVHYRDQMTKAGVDYDEQGYAGYYKALVASNVLKAVKDQRMNLSVEVGPGVIRSKGLLGDKYAWEFQYPVTLKLDGQQSSSPPQRFYFTQRIQQADVRVKHKGLEVTQVITNNAN